jgi:hypothetical protein
MARGTYGTHCRPQRNARFVNLGKIKQMWRFSVIWSQQVPEQQEEQFCVWKGVSILSYQT